MSTKEQYWKYSLITIIIGLGIILARQITPFLGGLLGALTIYILVRRQMMERLFFLGSVFLSWQIRSIARSFSPWQPMAYMVSVG